MKLLFIIFILFIFNISFGQDKNILFIGNSFTHCNNMPQYFDSICVNEHKDVNVTMFAKSSHTLKMHSDRDDLYETINSKKWDMVIVQGFSREFAQPDSIIVEKTLPYFDKIYSALMDNNTNVEVFLYMTWGYKYGYKHQKWNNSQQKMLSNIRHGYQLVSDKYGLSIIPVGDIWYTVYNGNKINLYQRDNQHPNKYGSILVTNSVYVALFNQQLHSYNFYGLEKHKLEVIRKSTNNFFEKFSTYYGLNRIDSMVSIRKREINILDKRYIYYKPKNDAIVYQYMNNVYDIFYYRKYSKMCVMNKGGHKYPDDTYHIIFIAPNRRENYVNNTVNKNL